MGDKPQSPQKQEPGQPGFFQRLLSLLFGTDDQEREKRRQLKRLASELGNHKYRFFKPRTGEVLPGLGKFFWEIYRVTGPAQTLLQGADNSNALKTILIESYHTEEQRKLHARLAESAIRETAAAMPAKELVAAVKNDMSRYLAGFDSDMVTKINRTFDIIRQLVDFVRFDYFFLLRKFDSTFVEGTFTHPPRLEPTNGEYLSDDIKDFLEVLLPMDFEADWDAAIRVLGQYKGVEVVDRAPWKKLLANLRGVAASGALTTIVRLIDEDPFYKPTVRREQKHIVESYLNVLKTQTEALMQKLLREMRSTRLQELAAAVFGAGPVERTKNYTESANAVFSRRMLSGYTHAQAVNYLTAFLVDYFSAQVKPLVTELLIVRGQWSDPAISRELSDAVYAVLAAADELVAFDEALADDGELGSRVRRAAGPVKQLDPTSTRLLRQALHDINERAMNLVKDAASNLVEVAKVVKLLIDDRSKTKPDLMLNWKELEAHAENPLTTELVAVYRKIFSFLQLLHMFVKK
jgi:hypothetical protein